MIHNTTAQMYIIQARMSILFGSIDENGNQTNDLGHRVMATYFQPDNTVESLDLVNSQQGRLLFYNEDWVVKQVQNQSEQIKYLAQQIKELYS